MKMKLLSWLKCSGLLFIFLFSCNKNKKSDMKIGYYHAIEIVEFQNGVIDTNYFKAIGSYQSKDKEKVYTFSVKENQYVSYYSFDFEQMTSKDLDSTQTNYIYYKISSYENSNIELTCFRVENNDSFTSNINFKYIE